MITKSRLLAITDGIIAVAATIMVMKLELPDEATLGAIMEQWPTLLAYMISYAQIFMAWHEHHDAFANAELINHRVFILNSAWLFFITLLPFVTAIAGSNPNDRASVLLYVGILAAGKLVLEIECNVIEKLNKQDRLDKDILQKLSILSFAAYGIAALSTMYRPILALIIIIGVSIYTNIAVAIYDKNLEY